MHHANPRPGPRALQGCGLRCVTRCQRYAKDAYELAAEALLYERMCLRFSLSNALLRCLSPASGFCTCLPMFGVGDWCFDSSVNHVRLRRVCAPCWVSESPRPPGGGVVTASFHGVVDTLRPPQKRDESNLHPESSGGGHALKRSRLLVGGVEQHGPAELLPISVCAHDICIRGGCLRSQASPIL